MDSLPDFDPDGLLPPGDYLLTIEQLRQSKLVLGPGTRWSQISIAIRKKPPETSSFRVYRRKIFILNDVRFLIALLAAANFWGKP